MSDLASVASCSGGKDSTAMILHMQEYNVPHQRVFADVGHEHPWTVDYVRFLSERIDGPPIQIVKREFTQAEFDRKRQTIENEWPRQNVPRRLIDRALASLRITGIPFLDLCQLRSSFPAHSARFCTGELKIDPIEKAVYEPLWAEGKTILSWQGIRHEESAMRSDLEPIQRIMTNIHNKQIPPLYAVRPLLDWTVNDVFRMHYRHGIEPNPLYKHGFTRVGCFPCIYASKDEIRIIAEMFPEYIDILDLWEELVGLVKKGRDDATFFHAVTLPEVRRAPFYWVPALDHNGNPRTLPNGAWRIKKLRAPIDRRKHGIRAVVEWSKTTYGGKQMDLLPVAEVKPDMAESCGSWGVCE